jgi:hypothetical protein
MTNIWRTLLLENVLRLPENEGGSDGGAPGSGEPAGAGGEGSGTPGDDGSEGDGGGEPGGEGEAEGEGTGAEGDGSSSEAPEALTVEAISLPEGFEASPETLSEFVDVLNDAEGTPQERADKLLAMHTKLVEETQAAQAQKWIDRQEAAKKEITEHATFGGDNLDASVDTVQAALKEFGSPELNDLLDSTGAGNSIHMFTFLHKIGQLMSEGKPLVGAPTSEKQSRAERMYPNQGKT